MPPPEPLPEALDPARDLVSSVLLDATPEEVFEAWADPALLATWWGPEGFSNTFHEFDFRPGGRWRFDMHGPNGASHPNESVFVEVVRPSRIVVDHVCAPRFVLTATLTPRGAMTEMVWRARFETAELLEALRPLATRGNSENFDRLGRLLFQRAEARSARP
jgi:uncharacterized protein YndB with AHSA1/START domain